MDAKRRLDALGRKAVALVQPTRSSSRAQPVGASRLGGLPELPSDLDWPVESGVPMMFIAQIDLASVRAEAGESALPPSGYLWFFASRFHEFSSTVFMDERVHGLAADEAAATRASVAAAVYRDITADSLAQRVCPEVDELPDEAFLPSHSDRVAPIQFEPFSSLPGAPSPFLPVEFEEREDYQRAREESRDGAPSQDWLLGHIPRGDWIGACKVGQSLLLRVSARNGAGFHWGDDDDVYFVISDGDLAARRFDRVTIHCGLG